MLNTHVSSRFFPRSFSRLLLSSTLAVGLLTGSASLLAEEESFQKDIEYRQGMMNVLAWNMKTMGGMLKGKIPYDAEAMKTHANDVASVASLNMAAGFPEDSTSEDSDALADIWFDFEDFEAKIADLRSAATGMQKAAASGDQAAVGAAMKDLGASCKGCHKKYRN